MSRRDRLATSNYFRIMQLLLGNLHFLSIAILLFCSPLRGADEKPLKIAAVVTAYYPNSHADVIVSRLLQGYNLNDREPRPKLQLVSLYVDQFPKNDISRELSKKHGFPIYDTVAKTLMLGGKELAVDGVLLIAEHGDYPDSAAGSKQYPKRRLMEEIFGVFRASDRVVPVYSDKHLSDNWEDAKWIFDTATELKVPLMAGSSLPVLWRRPAERIEQGAPIKEIVAVSYHRLDTYGFHALEMVQTLVEQRKQADSFGETGIARVQCLEGDAVWEAGKQGLYDAELFRAALARQTRQQSGKRTLQESVAKPTLFAIEYRDGLKANILTLNGAVREWSAAWQTEDGKRHATRFETQEARPYGHFSLLLQRIEQMMHAQKPLWPAERTLLTTGALDALLASRKQGGKSLETPWLHIKYQSQWQWEQPPEPAQNRSTNGQ